MALAHERPPIYFAGDGGESLGQHGHSKDHRPDLKQMVVGAVLDNQGRPVCCELWPGNTTDVKTLVPIVDRLQQRFGIQRICIVADRGMISRETLRELEKPERGWQYILGARMRSQNEVKDEVLSRAGRYRVVHPERATRKDPSPLKVKEVWVEDRRYVVCLNEDEARKDAADREAIVTALREKLRQGDKSLIGNRGYRRLVSSESETHFQIDEAKIAEEARYDGKWVLRTNTELATEDVALQFKRLWMVEHWFRSCKSLLETRPIYHKCDETIRGHVFCSFLALVLRQELQARLESRGHDLEWADVIDDVEELQVVEVERQGRAPSQAHRAAENDEKISLPCEHLVVCQTARHAGILPVNSEHLRYRARIRPGATRHRGTTRKNGDAEGQLPGVAPAEMS
jgi:transposase